MVSNNKDKGPLEEDIQDPELKEEVASEDEEEVEEVPRVHQRATIASIGVISNPSNTKRSARIAPEEQFHVITWLQGHLLRAILALSAT